jgi:hypothetical protein
MRVADLSGHTVGDIAAALGVDFSALSQSYCNASRTLLFHV